MTKNVEIKQKPTKCPECGNLEIAEIFYGEYREFLKKRDQNWIVNTFLYNFYSVIFVRRYSTGVMYSKVL